MDFFLSSVASAIGSGQYLGKFLPALRYGYQTDTHTDSEVLVLPFEMELFDQLPQTIGNAHRLRLGTVFKQDSKFVAA